MAISYELITGATLGSTTQYIDLTSISQNYLHLYLKCSLRSNRVGGDDGSVMVRLNSSTTNYDYQQYFIYYSNTMSHSDGTFGTSTYIQSLGIPQDPTNQYHFGHFELFIPNYSDSTRYKSVMTVGHNTRTINPGGIFAEGGGFFQDTSAISSIRLMTDAGSASFVTGSRYDLYGIHSS